MTDWTADPCTCGHCRGEHKLMPRGPWPASVRTRGGCGQCLCGRYDFDAAVAAEREAAERAARLAEWRADPLSTKAL